MWWKVWFIFFLLHSVGIQLEVILISSLLFWIYIWNVLYFIVFLCKAGWPSACRCYGSTNTDTCAISSNTWASRIHCTIINYHFVIQNFIILIYLFLAWVFLAIHCFSNRVGLIHLTIECLNLTMITIFNITRASTGRFSILITFFSLITCFPLSLIFPLFVTYVNVELLKRSEESWQQLTSIPMWSP